MAVNPIARRTSQISVIIFVVLLVLSLFLSSVEGDYWPWYAVMSVFAVVPLVIGPNRYRLMGAIALVLSGVLIISDIAAGKRLRAQHPEIQR
jgi:hypothetical protein